MQTEHGVQLDFLSMSRQPTTRHSSEKTAVIHAIDNAELQCMFYTPKGSQLQNPHCVVNYHEIGIYRTSNHGTIPASAAPNAYGLMTTKGCLPFPSATLQSSSIKFHP